MSTLCGKVCFHILREHFGDDAQTVGRILHSSGQIPLKNVFNNCKLPRKNVKAVLATLVQYGLVTCVASPGKPILEYRFCADKVLRILRYPKYLITTKKLYGKESEVLIEELLRGGRLTLSQVILNAYNRLTADKGSNDLDKPLIQRLRDQFEILINKQYIERLPLPNQLLDTNQRFLPLAVDLSPLVEMVSKGICDTADTVSWTINHSRFYQDIRDEIMVNAIIRRINQNAGDLLKILLRQAYLISPVNDARSHPVALHLIKEQARKANLNIEPRHVEDFMAVLAEDSCGFLIKDELSAQVAYIVNMKRSVEELTWTVLAAAVEVRYGVNAARIFRLVRKEEYIEQDEIQKRAMLPDKECKLLTYTLVQEGWLQQQELRKGMQKAGPMKTFYLFCIDLGQVVRMHIETCYRSLNNCMSRREHITTTHLSLLEREQRIQFLTHHLMQRNAPSSEISDIAEAITPSESALLEKIHAMINKCQQAELEIDSTLFILEMFIETKRK